MDGIEEKIKATHAYAVSCESKDGTYREQRLTRFSNGYFIIDFFMLLPGEEVPVKTQLPITAEGFCMLSALIGGAHKLDEYPILENPMTDKIEGD